MTRVLVCDNCGCRPRKPAINLWRKVYCVKCAHSVGMDPGEHNRDFHSYEEWKRLAAERQAA